MQLKFTEIITNRRFLLTAKEYLQADDFLTANTFPEYSEYPRVFHLRFHFWNKKFKLYIDRIF